MAAMLGLLWTRRAMASRWTIALGAVLAALGRLEIAIAAAALVLAAWAWFFVRFLRARRTPGRPRPEVLAEWRARLGSSPARSFVRALLNPHLRGEAADVLGELSVAGASRPSGSRWRMLAAAIIFLAARQVVLFGAAIAVVMLIILEAEGPPSLPAMTLALIAGRAVVGLADLAVSAPGRVVLVASFVRAARFEFWPTWVIYLALAPAFVRWTLRARHPLAFTACNPGIENGGGVVGESKLGILDNLRRGAIDAGLSPGLVAACCRTWPIEPGDPAQRTERLIAFLADPANDLRFPIVLKPDEGQRGFSVRVVRSIEDAERCFSTVPGRVIVQPWHHGPGEVGIVWLRTAAASADGGARSIYSITLKEFPHIVGDGERTIETLILRHPRFRLQAGRFLSRLAGRRLAVPAPGERVPIALAGNHCQGTLFRDGARLITPALGASIDALCRAFPGGLDAARLDIRYASEADLRAGRLDPDSIIELNGTLGETTNIYDPDKPLPWSLAVLRGQWAAMYALGRERMNAGARPLSLGRFVAILVRHRLSRVGSEVAD